MKIFSFLFSLFFYFDCISTILSLALKSFNKSISIAPNGLNTTLSGVAQSNLGNFQIAIDLFTKAFEYNDLPKSSIHIYRGDIYLRLSKKEEACLDFETAYKLGEGRELQKKHCQ